jgi:hypothetical protein
MASNPQSAKYENRSRGQGEADGGSEKGNSVARYFNV